MERAVVDLATNLLDINGDGAVDAVEFAVGCPGSVFAHIEEAVRVLTEEFSLQQPPKVAECPRCRRLEAQLTLERRTNAELRAAKDKLGRVPQLEAQLAAAQRKIIELSAQLGILSPSGESRSTAQAVRESDRMRSAVGKYHVFQASQPGAH